MKDPMLLATPDTGRELFTRMAAQANGFPVDAAIDAAINILVNSIRQSHPTKAAAEARFDELFGRAKTVLTDHYDSIGRKRGVFPFDQTIQMSRADFKSRI